MSSLSGLDTWSVISGAIGVLTVLPLICAFIWTQHPETKFAQLDSTLKETENLLRSVVEEGLLDPERHVAHFELHLQLFRRKTEQFRDETYMASNGWRKLLGAWYNGLSKRISVLCKKVKAVRANISETSANARMELMEQSRDEVLLFQLTWRAKIAQICKHIASLVYTRHRAAAEITDVPASTTSVAPTSERPSSFVETIVATFGSEAPCTRSPSQSPPSRKASTSEPSRSSRPMFRTASKAHDHHVLTRALRRVERKLTAQGVTNALLAQLVEATHKQWSPASGKAHPPRRSRRHQGSVPRPTHALALQPASEPWIESDVDSSGEETMCEE